MICWEDDGNFKTIAINDGREGRRNYLQRIVPSSQRAPAQPASHTQLLVRESKRPRCEHKLFVTSSPPSAGAQVSLLLSEQSFPVKPGKQTQRPSAQTPRCEQSRGIHVTETSPRNNELFPIPWFSKYITKTIFEKNSLGTFSQNSLIISVTVKKYLRTNELYEPSWQESPVNPG